MTLFYLGSLLIRGVYRGETTGVLAPAAFPLACHSLIQSILLDNDNVGTSV